MSDKGRTITFDDFNAETNCLLDEETSSEHCGSIDEMLQALQTASGLSASAKTSLSEFEVAYKDYLKACNRLSEAAYNLDFDDTGVPMPPGCEIF